MSRIKEWYPESSYLRVFRFRSSVGKAIGPIGYFSYALMCQDAYHDGSGLTCRDIANRLHVDKETIRRKMPFLYDLIKFNKEGNCGVYRAIEPDAVMAELLYKRKAKTINHWTDNLAHTKCLLPSGTDISISECLLLGQLYSLADQAKGIVVRTNFSGLALLCGESRHTIARHIQALEALGLVSILTKITRCTKQVSIGIKKPNVGQQDMFAKRAQAMNEQERAFTELYKEPEPEPETTPSQEPPKPVENIVKTTPAAKITSPKLSITNSMNMDRMYLLTKELRKQHRYNHHWGKLTTEEAKQIRVNESERAYKKCRAAKIDNRVSDIVAACVLNCWISNAALNEAITKVTSPFTKVNNPSGYLETLIHTMLENDHNNMRE